MSCPAEISQKHVAVSRSVPIVTSEFLISLEPATSKDMIPTSSQIIVWREVVVDYPGDFDL